MHQCISKGYDLKQRHKISASHPERLQNSEIDKTRIGQEIKCIHGIIVEAITPFCNSESTVATNLLLIKHYHFKHFSLVYSN